MKWIFFIMMISSCQENSSIRENVSDSVYVKAKQETDSIIDESLHNAIFDTVGISSAPVKIMEFQISSTSTLERSIIIKYRNVSDKKISGIRFRWFGLNAFNEPAQMGSSLEGMGIGFTDNDLEPGKISSGTWVFISKDAKKLVLAWPYEIAFSDGTIWRSQRK